MGNEAKKILVVVSPERQSTEGFHWALHRAKEAKRALRIVYVVDEETTDRVQASLSNVGFVGDKPGQELSEALNKEYRQRGKKVLEEMEKQCRSFGVSFETDICQGVYLDVCESLAGKDDVDLMVVTEKKESRFKKMFEGSELKKLRERVPCEIKAYPSG